MVVSNVATLISSVMKIDQKWLKGLKGGKLTNT